MVALAYFLAFWLRFEGYPKWPYGSLFAETIAWAVLIHLVALGAFGQYQRLWRFVGQRDYEAVLKSVVVGHGRARRRDRADPPGRGFDYAAPGDPARRPRTPA